MYRKQFVQKKEKPRNKLGIEEGSKKRTIGGGAELSERRKKKKAGFIIVKRAKRTQKFVGN